MGFYRFWLPENRLCAGNSALINLNFCYAIFFPAIGPGFRVWISSIWTRTTASGLRILFFSAISTACLYRSPLPCISPLPTNRYPSTTSLFTTATDSFEPSLMFLKVAPPVPSVKISVSSFNTRVERFGATFGCPSLLQVPIKHCCLDIISFISSVSLAINSISFGFFGNYKNFIRSPHGIFYTFCQTRTGRVRSCLLWAVPCGTFPLLEDRPGNWSSFHPDPWALPWPLA